MAALGGSLVLAGVAAAGRGDPAPLYEQLGLIGGLAVLTLARVLAAPAYHRWYARMHRPEADGPDRARTG